MPLGSRQRGLQWESNGEDAWFVVMCAGLLYENHVYIVGVRRSRAYATPLLPCGYGCFFLSFSEYRDWLIDHACLCQFLHVSVVLFLWFVGMYSVNGW